jgi:hypothetical protein
MIKESKVKVVISDNPYPIPIEMRPIWRIALIIVSIHIVSGEKKYLDLKKVNILVWMLIRKNRWEEYQDYLLGLSDKLPLVSIDTATYKAVEFSMAKNLTQLDAESGRLNLTPEGNTFFSILVANDIMSEEIQFLKHVGKKLSDTKIKDLSGGQK